LGCQLDGLDFELWTVEFRFFGHNHLRFLS
jgi:hypothetical protein